MEKAKKLLTTTLRNINTSITDFRYSAEQLAYILAQETLNHLDTKSVHITTQEGETAGIQCTKEIVLLPILRSGIALLPPFLYYFPHAKVGFFGIKRSEETAQPHLYYQNLPPIKSDQQLIILDPMIATGETGLTALHILKEKGARQEQIIFVHILSANQAIKTIKEIFSNMTFIGAAQDNQLNSKKYIVPGLGDFGDRFFGTE